MNKIEKILTLYPQILELRKAQFSLVEICEIFDKQKIININYKTLSSIISKVKNKTIHPEYSKIVPILDDYQYRDTLEAGNFIKFHNTWFCFSNYTYDQKWKVTEDNIYTMPNPADIVYVKRFLKLYHISDEILLKKYFDIFTIEATPKEQIRISSVEDNIKEEFNTIIYELKQKSLRNILKITF